METTSNPTNPTDPQPDGGIDPVHLYVLLDRSGSMSSIRSEVIGGFNAFVAGQQINGDDARLTLVQFDTQDLAETVIDDAAIRRVRSLRAPQFQPRGGTPLLDATAHLIARARARTDRRAAEGTTERVVIVTITDGLENASREFDRAQIRDLVADREQAGWTFVYLSAGLDAYDEATSFGYSPGSVQSWAPDAEGAALAFASLDVAMSAVRSSNRAGERWDQGEVFGGAKPAEADRRTKRGDAR